MLGSDVRLRERAQLAGLEPSSKPWNEVTGQHARLGRRQRQIIRPWAALRRPAGVGRDGASDDEAHAVITAPPIAPARCFALRRAACARRRTPPRDGTAQVKQQEVSCGTILSLDPPSRASSSVIL
jgi:hypothetical protein